MTRRLLPCLLVLGLALAACDETNKNLDAEDTSNPHFQAAADALAQNDYAGAAKAYEDALAASPNVASAHYELGILYGDRLNDPVRAMYHYQAYIDRRPAAENRAQAEQLLEVQKKAFVASLPNSPIQNSEAVARIEAENRELRNRIADLQAKLAAAPAAGSSPAPATGATVMGEETTTTTESATETIPFATGSILSEVASETTTEEVRAAEPAQAARSHTVAQGDNLWKISKQYYEGNVMEGIKRIEEANPGVNPKNLKIGTVLVIP